MRFVINSGSGHTDSTDKAISIFFNLYKYLSLSMAKKYIVIRDHTNKPKNGSEGGVMRKSTSRGLIVYL